MQRFMTSRRSLFSLAALCIVLAVTVSSLVIVHPTSAAPNPYVSLAGSFSGTPAGAQLRGQHASSDQLTISVVLRPRSEAALNSLLAALYNPHSSQYHQWLSTGEFDTLFAPPASQVAQVQNYLTQAGLSVIGSSTPFLLRATGTTAQIQAAFHTQISDYRAVNGQSFFQNSSVVEIPTGLGSAVLAVAGLSNTARLHSHYTTTYQAARSAGKPVPHYGAGPGGSGLIPSQTSGLYGAKGVYQLGSRGKGKGATLAVFELSGYTPADITTFEQQFFGPGQNVPVVDVNVDGGPVTPHCPKGDQCGPFGAPPCANGCNAADYSGDIEVEADIEMQIAIAPKIDQILVYNAPNDTNGITIVDEYFQIANDNRADSISSSWGACEPDMGFSAAQAESIAFEQMATQGQSMAASAGDTGAYDCIRDTGSPNQTVLSVDDPASQPYVTGVGGTSLGSFDPGSDAHPTYPAGFETVWNVLNLCSGSNQSACSSSGAGGRRREQLLGQTSVPARPRCDQCAQPEAPYCSQATTGQSCREVPDVSANADEFTPYAEYCTGSATTNSTCASFSSTQPAPGWFGIGGTSLSSPLWASVIALWDSVHGERLGNANPELYRLFRSENAYSQIFHDVTGKNQTENNNGFYPTTPNYDMATGIRTPRITGFAKSNP